jgi:hypothetical protein
MNSAQIDARPTRVRRLGVCRVPWPSARICQSSPRSFCLIQGGFAKTDSNVLEPWNAGAVGGPPSCVYYLKFSTNMMSAAHWSHCEYRIELWSDATLRPVPTRCGIVPNVLGSPPDDGSRRSAAD